MFERQILHTDLHLEEVDVFAKLSDGVKRRVVLERQTTDLSHTHMVMGIHMHTNTHNFFII